MRYPRRHAIVYLFTLPADLAIWIIVLFFWALWGTRLQWMSEGLWFELKPDSWPTCSWYRIKFYGEPQLRPPSEVSKRGRWHTWAGTTLGHGGFYGPGSSGGKGIDTTAEVHESVHVEQFEMSMLMSFCIAILISGVLFYFQWPIMAAVLGIGIWFSGYVLMLFSGWIVAFLRGEKMYKGSIHEESAYAIAEEYERKRLGL